MHLKRFGKSLTIEVDKITKIVERSYYDVDQDATYLYIDIYIPDINYNDCLTLVKQSGTQDAEFDGFKKYLEKEIDNY
jgi:hypothetical protein